jgi:hypothetical protein
MEKSQIWTISRTPINKFSSIEVLSISINEINTVGDLEIEEDNNTVDGHSVVDYTNIISH